MAKSDLITSISALSRKIDALMAERETLIEKINELKKENGELRIQHERDVINLDNANKDIHFLSLSYRLADSPEALIDARKEISKLLRTIDSCIRVLKED